MFYFHKIFILNTIWIAIFNSITDIARRYNNQLYFIISPIIPGGKYNGWLPVGEWDTINELSL